MSPLCRICDAPMAVATQQRLCKACVTAQNREYYRRNREKMLAKAKAWNEQNRVRKFANMDAWKAANREAGRVYARKRRVSGQSETEKACRKEHPERHRARVALAKAVRTGKIKRQPCWVCGEPNSHGHHSSYDRDMRLDVVWLCPSHHKLAHAALVRPHGASHPG